MKSCSECGNKMVAKAGLTPESVEYHYYQCPKCGEEIVDMEQLHTVAEKYRILKTYRVKVSKWGTSVGIRIPQELVKRYHLGLEVSMIPEKEGIKIIA